MIMKSVSTDGAEHDSTESHMQTGSRSSSVLLPLTAIAYHGVI